MDRLFFQRGHRIFCLVNRANLLFVGESGGERILPKTRIYVLIAVEFERNSSALLWPRSLQWREIPNRPHNHHSDCEQSLPRQLNRLRLAHNCALWLERLRKAEAETCEALSPRDKRHMPRTQARE